MTDRVCPSQPAHLLSGVNLGKSVDYLALRFQAAKRENDHYVAAGDPQTTESIGTPCATATNRAACAQALADLRPALEVPARIPGGPPDNGTASYFVHTKGDEVGAAKMSDNLAPLVSPVGNVGTAAFLVHRNGYTVSCNDTPNARTVADGFEVVATSGDGCGRGNDINEHLLHVSKDGQITVEKTVRIQEGNPNCVYGRRPEGFAPTGASYAENALGRYFAEVAELEAASVPAFLRLAGELTHHHAPSELIERARLSARDEVRHTAAMTALARRFGAEPSPAIVPERGLRTLFEIALENAVEGCVHETFAALQATFQAVHATDRAVRKVMRRIAEDETRHGALAWSVAAWIEPQLSESERAQIERARVAAVETLLHSFVDPHPTVAQTAGAPTASQCASLLRAVSGELWAA